MPRVTSRRNAALTGGWRSGLEGQLAEQLSAAGVAAAYEPFKLPYVKPARNAKYTPDFVLPNGIIVESKGRFVTEDRQKHKLIRAQHPDLDIRFVFSNSRAKIGKKSSTSYAAWCREYGFQFADKWIPESWLREPVNHASKAAIARLTGERT